MCNTGQCRITPKKMTIRLTLIFRYMSRYYFIWSLDMWESSSNLKSWLLTPIWDQVHCSQHICGCRFCAATLWASSSHLNWGKKTWAYGYELVQYNVGQAHNGSEQIVRTSSKLLGNSKNLCLVSNWCLVTHAGKHHWASEYSSVQLCFIQDIAFRGSKGEQCNSEGW